MCMCLCMHMHMHMYMYVAWPRASEKQSVQNRQNQEGNTGTNKSLGTENCGEAG
jgi:hypothetical protein